MGYFYDSDEHKAYSFEKARLKGLKAEGKLSEKEYELRKLEAKLCLWKGAKALRGCKSEARDAALLAGQIMALGRAQSYRSIDAIEREKDARERAELRDRLEKVEQLLTQLNELAANARRR